jgi:hypothetical protein
MADDLITRIRARLDRNEQAARLIEARGLGNLIPAGIIDKTGATVFFTDEAHALISDALDPDVLLKDIDMRRRILLLHEPAAPGYPCPTCWDGAEDGGPMDFPCPTVRALARED